MELPRDNQSDRIRITLDDLADSHVDDLLRRQMSLRGEPGVSRDRRRWFLQNWFILMVAGGLAALAAWFIIEPAYEDMIYIQGPIQKIDRRVTLPTEVRDGDQTIDIKGLVAGTIIVNGQEIWILNDTEAILNGKTHGVVQPGMFHPGQRVGVYLEAYSSDQGDVALAHYIAVSPLRKVKPKDMERMPLADRATKGAAVSLLFFPIVAGLVGLFIGAADGLICHLPRRAFLAGGIGLLTGLIGGFFSQLIAGLVYNPLNQWAISFGAGQITTTGFIVQVLGRALAWALAGMAMGLGQGIALRSGRLFTFGFIGGIVGGLLGGLLFDPIDFFVFGMNKPTAEFSRLVGFVVIGLCVGALIGIVELLARDAWLRMTEGPLAGKEFLIFKDNMNIGASPKMDIYLFNDQTVASHHAVLRAIGNECELEAVKAEWPVFLNERPIRNARLRHGDRISIGRTVFVFQKEGQ